MTTLFLEISTKKEKEIIRALKLLKGVKKVSAMGRPPRLQRLKDFKNGNN